MPRVSERTAGKTKDDRTRTCERCDAGVKPGEKVYTWSFFRQPARWQHVTHGYPKQSQLTQSKMTVVYEAVEDADLSSATDAEELQAALQQVAESVREVAEEYEQSADAMGEAGSEMQERAGELESWADELESWEPSEEWDPDAAGDEPAEDKPVGEERTAVDTEAQARKAWGSDPIRPIPGDSGSPVLTGVVTPPEPELTEEQQARFDEWLEAARTEAQELLDSCPV